MIDKNSYNFDIFNDEEEKKKMIYIINFKNTEKTKR